MATDADAHPFGVHQASAIPFRWQGGRLEVCLITASRNPNKWVVPKGLIERGDTPGETALKEAPLGHYRYKKVGRWLSVLVFVMEVDQAEARWAEANRRRRCWVEPQHALRLLTNAQLKPLFALALDRMVHCPSNLESVSFPID